MGRKPNQLVHEFFARGRKLEDASNRYEHTCKKCGEFFPKGRVDALLSHLLKRCPNVTQANREHVYFHLQTNPPPKPSIKGSKSIGKSCSAQISSNTPEQDATHSQEAQGPVSGTSNIFQQPSALETLAEVSRQHLDFSARRERVAGPAPAQAENARDNDRILAEQALLFGFQQAANTGHQSALPATQDRNFYGTNAETSNTDPFASELPPPSPQRDAPTHYEPSYPHGLPLTAQPQPSYIFGHALDPELSTTEPQTSSQHLTHSPNSEWRPPSEDAMQWNPTNSSGRPSQMLDAVAAPANERGTGFGLLQNGSRRSARARFSDDRRKEVQKLRKQGACIRCRMLKKPCSDGTPCNTCANVTSARLWKGKCVRTRLAGEFTLYSTTLFYATARSKLPVAMDGLHRKVVPGRMQARLFPTNGSCFCFAIELYSSSESIDDASWPAQQVEAPQTDSFLLVDEGERMSSKIEEYLHQNTRTSLLHEPCRLMRATIQKALELVDEEQSEQFKPASDDKARRSCYNLQQAQLLKNVMALWVGTGFLIGPDDMLLELKYDASSDPHEDVVPEPSPPRHVLDTSSPMYRHLKAQILASMESCCSQLAKDIINELERRLLQRQQVSRFSTFMAAVILLGCAERMAYFYRVLDDGPLRNDTGDEAQMSASAQNTRDGSRWFDWPLNTRPSALWPQGEHFAQLLAMLLRMRALLPATRASDDGKLIVIQDFAPQAQAGAMMPKVQQVAEQARVAAQWLDPLELDVAKLKATRDAREERAKAIGGRQAWDTAFMAFTLLPETPT
ncbi:transcription factor-like protein 21 [Teratosphaeria destructans]|uniref:Transcription factor-like protein 21 n=1 Tax=Teratosphaeria destructans TaxID=418781 RepID=A0A9W7SRD8_9PEZI|nr:transcription factor-like protein 21 [Teratosphaeria destructans]